MIRSKFLAYKTTKNLLQGATKTEKRLLSANHYCVCNFALSSIEYSSEVSNNSRTWKLKINMFPILVKVIILTASSINANE